MRSIVLILFLYCVKNGTGQIGFGQETAVRTDTEKNETNSDPVVGGRFGLVATALGQNPLGVSSGGSSSSKN